MPIGEALRCKKNVFPWYVLQFKRFEWSRTLMEHGGQIASTRHQHRSLEFVCEVLKRYVFFHKCFGRHEVGLKSEMSATLADNSIPSGWFSRARRKRRGAREEKEEGY